MGRPRIHDDGTRDRLFRAAESVVAYGGVDALSVRGLAEVAGTTTRAVYSVFEGKEGIVRALYREAWLVLERRVEEAPITEDPAEDLVRLGLEAFRGFALKRPNLFRLAFEGRLPFVPKQDDMAAALAARAQLRRRVKRCADAGLLGDSSVEAVSYQFHALCQGLASNELSGWYVGADPQRMWEDGLRALVLGLTRPAQAKPRPPARKSKAGRSKRPRKSRAATR